MIQIAIHMKNRYCLEIFLKIYNILHAIMQKYWEKKYFVRFSKDICRIIYWFNDVQKSYWLTDWKKFFGILFKLNSHKFRVDEYFYIPYKYLHYSPHDFWASIFHIINKIPWTVTKIKTNTHRHTHDRCMYILIIIIIITFIYFYILYADVGARKRNEKKNVM